MNTGRFFPSLRIVEEKMTNKEILETFNTAFGGDAVAKVVKAKGSRIIHIDQSNEQRMYMWDEFYEALDEFYEALDEYGAVWIKAEYLGDEDVTLEERVKIRTDWVNAYGEELELRDELNALLA